MFFKIVCNKQVDVPFRRGDRMWCQSHAGGLRGEIVSPYQPQKVASTWMFSRSVATEGYSIIERMEKKLKQTSGLKIKENEETKNRVMTDVCSNYVIKCLFRRHLFDTSINNKRVPRDAFSMRFVTNNVHQNAQWKLWWTKMSRRIRSKLHDIMWGERGGDFKMLMCS